MTSSSTWTPFEGKKKKKTDETSLMMKEHQQPSSSTASALAAAEEDADAEVPKQLKPKTITFSDDVMAPVDKEKCQEIVDYYDYGYDEHNKIEDARCPATFAENKPKPKRKTPWQKYCDSWKKNNHQRVKNAALGCTSASIVLAIRLWLDHEPLAYLIHSIIVFLDMILIHIFADTWWLSLGGELLTIAHFLAFHFTKETVWELLETTLIAVLCSFQLIATRGQAREANHNLQADIKVLRRQTVLMMRQSMKLHENSGVGTDGRRTTIATHSSTDVDEEADDDNMSQDSIPNPIELAASATITALDLEKFLEDNEKTIAMEEGIGPETERVSTSSIRRAMDEILHQDPEEMKEAAKVCGERFFEYFLDGSAGVMYTSFLGLIITEFIRYGEKGY